MRAPFKAYFKASINRSNGLGKLSKPRTGAFHNNYFSFSMDNYSSAQFPKSMVVITTIT